MESELTLTKLPLSDRERILLGDPDAYRVSTGVPMAGRVASALEIRGIVTTDSWAALEATGLTLVDCALQAVDLSRAVFYDVTFERCKLERCRYHETTFQNCRFIDCHFSQGTATNTRMLSCTFEGSTLSGILFESGTFDRVQYTRGTIEEVGLSECTLSDLRVHSATVERLSLTLCTSQSMSFDSCALRTVVFLGGTCRQLTFLQGQLSRLSLAELTTDDLTIEGVAAVTGLNVNECAVERFLISACPKAIDLYVFNSKIRQLHWRGGLFDGWLTECVVGPESSIDDAELDGFFWDQSQLQGLMFRRVLFRQAICARQSQFTDMKLVDVRYDPNIELLLEGAVFTRCDSFAGGSLV